MLPGRVRRLFVSATMVAALAFPLALMSASGAGAVTPPRSVMHDFNGDMKPDLLALTSTGRLYAYYGNGATGFLLSSKLVGIGWQSFTAIVAVGDWNGDGHSDLIVRNAAGTLTVYFGSVSGFTRGQTVGIGFKGLTLIGPGDWTGNGFPALIARDGTGRLWLYHSNGTTLVGPPSLIGIGWLGLKMVAPGDWNGDGFPDLIARDPSGNLWLYKGNGTGFAGGRTLIGIGWKQKITGVGDWNSDGHVDLIYRDNGGGLWLYPGNGATGFSPKVKIGIDWQSFVALI